MTTKYAIALSSLFALTACSSSSDDNSASSGTGSSNNQGSLSISLTDAPVDKAANVFVTIAGVALNYQDNGWQDFTFDSPEKIDLLTLQEGETITLFQDDSVAAGTYQVRLNLFSNNDNELDHYIIIDEGGDKEELFIPSGEQTGLKLNTTILVPVNGDADYTIDFDVRRSVVLRGNENNNNGYLLKPVLRLIDNTVAGTLSGIITDETLLVNGCSDGDPLTHNVIYVFEGPNVTPDDYGSAGAQAVTTANVNFNLLRGEYTYTTGPLLEGEYTISLTCNADLEVMEADDELLFKATENRTVSAP